MKRSEEGGGEGAKSAGWICVWSLWSVCQPWDHLEILCHLQGVVWATTRWCSSSASGRHLLPLGRLFQTGKSGGGCKGLERKSAQRTAPQFLQRDCSVSALKEIPFLAPRQAAFCSNKLVVFLSHHGPGLWSSERLQVPRVSLGQSPTPSPLLSLMYILSYIEGTLVLSPIGCCIALFQEASLLSSWCSLKPWTMAAIYCPPE